jgi:hypothetical protein
MRQACEKKRRGGYRMKALRDDPMYEHLMEG